jgi:hypothetical protein
MLAVPLVGGRTIRTEPGVAVVGEHVRQSLEPLILRLKYREPEPGHATPI